MLEELGVTNIALSYVGLRRRTKFIRPWLIKDKFGPDVSVFLDSGAYTIKEGWEDKDGVSVPDIAEHYKKFTLENLDSVDLVSEFDASPMGPDWVEYQRREFYDQQIPREKFMPIWHSEWWDMKYLQAMAERYEVIGIKSSSLDEITPMLNAIAAGGTHLHGVAMTQVEAMQKIRWGSVSSISWLSPTMHGDTIVWTGKELKRYPKKYKDEARKRHRTLFVKNGFDADKIAADDNNEVLRLSVWSWLQFEQYINNHQNGVRVTHQMPTPEALFVEPGAEVVVQPPSEDGKEQPTTPSTEVVIHREANTMLPGMGITFQPKRDPDNEDEESVPMLNIRSGSSRVCNSCFLANKCPMYLPGSNCAYNIPVTIRTRSQLRAVHYSMVEMQTQRVLFMKFAEDAEGGYADPNLSKEMNLLEKMIKTTEEMEQEGFDVSLRLKGSASQLSESGMISRLFGKEAGQSVQQLGSEVVSVDEIIDAEILGE